MEYFKQKDIFIFDGFVGAMKQYTLPIRIVCEYAYQSLFAHQLFIRPSKEQLDKFNAEFTVIAAPGFKCKGKEDGVNSEAFVIINFDKKNNINRWNSICRRNKKSCIYCNEFFIARKRSIPYACIS